ncbi:hypothetical protein OROHE_019589 [Orobanche hederae]
MTNMPGGEERKLSNQDIQLLMSIGRTIPHDYEEKSVVWKIMTTNLVIYPQVQNRIEQCLQHYMNKKEVINTLIVQDNIQPCFTELVWQRLEEENQEFFKAYYLKLLVKDQIMEFNRLLSEQVDLMHRIGLSGMGPVLPSNRSHVSPTQHIPTSVAQNARSLETDNVQPAEVFDNYRRCMPGNVVDGSVHNRKIDVSSNMFLSRNGTVGLAQTMMNGKITKPEGGDYAAGSLPFDFTPNSRNYVESHPMTGDASISSFSSVDSNVQHINGALLDSGGDASPFGFLAQMQQNLSLPEFGAGFVSGSELLDSYCRPPFIGSDANNFVDPHGNVESLDPEWRI